MKSLIFCLALCLASAANAAPVPELTKFLEDEISVLDRAVSDSSHDSLDATPTDTAWFLRNFAMRLRAKAGFEIPGLAKIEVIPEAEILWQRVYPDGWGTYKPRQ